VGGSASSSIRAALALQMELGRWCGRPVYRCRMLYIPVISILSRYWIVCWPCTTSIPCGGGTDGNGADALSTVRQLCTCGARGGGLPCL